jgi:ubiquinone/menaquinone biosynthesis C-methylase UbiE
MSGSVLILLVVLAAAIGLLLVVSVGWRLWSTRAALPCPSWLSWLVELDNPLFRTNRAAVIIAGLDLAPGAVALDAGCGPGRLTLPMARQVGEAGRVVAVDLQPEMLRKVEAKAKLAGLANIEFREGRLGAGALETSGFDRAVLVTVLGEIPDQRAALSELYGALKPGGVLAITEVIADPHFQPREAVLRLAREAGFREARRIGGRLSYTLYLEKPLEA